ncbi:hypothetical protein RN51_01082 [Microbacterium oxydans]|uniref:Uncharacterized protein n=1 Tax=Microbacterium oxydans TaxID=82380 RepID=A0A0F0KVH8_9MICO|nr:hypothetical protein [Microbacterium oxydans]KJL24484.1 hypothetical protein RN51_01082 [Microbacterium oxydans]
MNRRPVALDAPSARRRPMRRAILLALAAVVLGALGVLAWKLFAPAPSSYDALDATDREMLRQLSEQYDVTASRGDAVWTDGYQYEQQPIVLLRTDGEKSPIWSHAFLVNMSGVTDTTGMAKIDVPGATHLDDVRISDSFGAGDAALHLPANFSPIEVDGREVLAFKYHDAMLQTESTTSQGFQRFSMHENFHVTKQGIDSTAAGAWPWEAGGLIEDYPHTEEHYELLRVEARIFDRVENETDPQVLSALATDLANVRMARYTTWPTLRLEIELEAIEGTATYFERAFDRARGLHPKVSTFADGLELFISDPEQNVVLERDYAYFTGAQLGLLLDTVAPEWQQSIEPAPSGEAATPFATLQRATGVTVAPDEAELRAIVDRYL